MALMDRLRGFVGGDDRVFHYQCTSCETVFESAESDMTGLTCPQCGSRRVRTHLAP